MSLATFITGVASRREFVEVLAGTPAFVMITDLPKEAQGVDADPPQTAGLPSTHWTG